MLQLVRGFRGKLEDHLNVNQPIQVRMETQGNAVYDTCCFGVDVQDKLSDDRYMVFYNQTRSPGGEITYRMDRNAAEYTVSLGMLPHTINKLVFTVSIDGSGTMGQIRSHVISIMQNGQTALELRMTGADFHSEKAIIGIEIYKKSVWRVNVVASGFNGGLGDLLQSYGGEIADDPAPQPAPYSAPQPTPYSAPQPAPTPAPSGMNRPDYSNRNFKSELNRPPYSAPSPAPTPMRSPSPAPAPMPSPAPAPASMPAKVELRKGQKVSLEKKGSGGGEIVVNLNWSQPQRRGLFGYGGDSIDLDLECLYELENGGMGAVQAIGNHFGAYAREPYIMLDGDDRSGANSAGENLRINSEMIPRIRRILIYTSIYEGVANWAEAQGVVTIKCPGNPDIIVRMDEYHPSRKICAIALLENNGRGGFSVEKRVEYFENKPNMDSAFHWGLQWGYGKK